MVTSSYSVLIFAMMMLHLFAVYAILAGDREPLEKLRWLAVLILLPIAGLLLYFIIGRDRQHDAHAMP